MDFPQMFPNFIHVLLSQFNVPEQYFATARDHPRAKDNQPTSKALTATHRDIYLDSINASLSHRKDH